MFEGIEIEIGCLTGVEIELVVSWHELRSKLRARIGIECMVFQLVAYQLRHNLD